jgi:phosphate:Na+ symporter
VIENTMWFETAYTFLGGLGIFFFGMKTLSESLQALSGDVIRRAIRTLISNRLMGVAVGTFVTMLVQSSTVTTVMVVSLVNAGLMQLTQAIGVIFGANIGTTITGWIIAIRVGKYGLLLVGLGIFPLLFGKGRRLKHTGSLLVALGFVFLGLEFMSNAFRPLRGSETFLEIMQYFTAESFGSLLACVAVGAGLTVVIQSSSAMLGVTIALASTGSISFMTAAALVLGENIGTTITALLASVGANSGAKRAARAHASFNLLAVCLMLPFFWRYVAFIDSLVGGAPDTVGADGLYPLVAAHIAAIHTGFNVTATLVFLPFVNHLARFVTWITPAPAEREVPHLKYLPSVQDFEAPTLGLAMAEKELQNMADITGRCVRATSAYLLSEKPSAELGEKVMFYEKVTDSIQAEITVFLRSVQRARLTDEQSSLSYAVIRAADELESITDYCASVIRAYDRLRNAGETFSEAARADLGRFADGVVKYYEDIENALMGRRSWNLKHFERGHDLLTEQANRIREAHRERVSSNACGAQASMSFSDIIVGLRKLKAHALNIAEAMAS